MVPGPPLVERFAADLDALANAEDRVGLAVSGGPDSIALLLLAAAARPGTVEAATVDHALRSESGEEAEAVARLCERLGVPHATLRAAWTEPPLANVQARAREQRYQALAAWAAERGLGVVATAHHLDDQAETLLMRIARGAGVGGLAGVQPTRPLADGIALIRPLLSWPRAELHRIVADAGIDPLDDPSNRNPRFDRSRARALLAREDWLGADRLAAVASHAAEAEQALAWATMRELDKRRQRDGESLLLDPVGLPREILRRLLLAAIEELSGETPPGPKLIAALAMLERGGVTTLAGLKLEGGARWRLSAAPPRR